MTSDFKPRILLSAYQARPLLEARKTGHDSATTSVDIGRSKVKAGLDDGGVHLPGEPVIPWRTLQRIAEEDRRVFWIEDGGAHPVQVYSEETGWVRVLCPARTAPTVLVSGIPMHRIKDTDPIADTESKLKALGRPKGRVLDTATGLGYTAIAAARTASEVVTIELDPAAIEIARLNPWSQELFEGSNIRQIIGDAFEEIEKLPAGSFADVIHDPPTMSLGGDLYSEQFYLRLHRVMRRGGKLFHYIGDPESGIGKRLYPGVMKRLGQAGFHGVTRHEAAFGLTAIS